MKISLINARNSDSTVTPYGLLSIAAVLERDGHKVQVLDPFFENFFFMEYVEEFKPDLVGISTLTASYPRAKDIVNIIRRKMPQAKICVGGIHATALPERTLRDLAVDFVVLGEGEPVLADICNHFNKIDDLINFDGIAFLKGRDFVEKPKKPLIDNLDDLPFPAWHLLPIEKYFIPPGYIRSYFLERTLVVFSSRGCPYQCIFCASHRIFGRKLRRHSVDYFLNHLEFVIGRYKLDGIYVMDDTFTLDDNWLGEFCREKKRRKTDILWGCQGRVSAISEKELSMLKDAGCIQIDFGVESGSEKVLKAIKKRINIEDIERTFKLCHKVGIRPYASIMIGNPEEDEEDVLMTLKLLKRIKPVYTSVGFTQPIPGSELYNTAKEKGWFDDSIGFYGPRWDVRLSTEPIMAIKLDKRSLKLLRAKLQNTSFIQNYVTFISFKSLFFIFSLLGVIILNPLNFLRAIKKSFKSHKLDDIVDFLLAFYRLQMMRSRIKTLADL